MCSSDLGTYEFMPLFWTNSKGKPMEWRGFVRLIPKANQIKHKVNWDPSEEKDTVPITADHLKPNPNNASKGLVDIDEDTVAQIWTVSGRSDRSPTVHIPTYVKKGKNLGKANETSPLTQALIDMQTKFHKKWDIGYRPQGYQEEEVKGAGKPYYMMAYHKWIDSPRNPDKHILFPAAASIKYDGTRTQLHCDDGKVFMSSRRRKIYPSKKYLDTDLMRIFRKFPNIYLDAEAFACDEDGTPLNLNEINGRMAKEDPPDYDPKNDPHPIELRVFDVFIPEGKSNRCIGMQIEPQSPFANRLAFLNCIFTMLKPKYVKQVKQEIMADEKEYDEYHDAAVAAGHEGSVIRNLAAPYEFSLSREVRSYQVRKRKPRYDGKYTVVDYTQGTSGKAVGAIIMVLETKKEIGRAHV
mgnify:CR=1 FL=1